jgi:hypothetical protein
MAGLMTAVQYVSDYKPQENKPLHCRMCQYQASTEEEFFEHRRGAFVWARNGLVETRGGGMRGIETEAGKGGDLRFPLGIFQRGLL